jgi:hypothetical protein
MVKPIIYHNINEKKKLEAKLFSKIPLEKRKAISQEFIALFSSLRDRVGIPKSIQEDQKIRK